MIEINVEPMTTSSGNCGVHESTDWQIATDLNFTNIVHESLNDTVNLTSYIYNNSTFYPNLYARVRYRTTSCLTNWSTIILSEEQTYNAQIATPAVRYDIDENKVIASEFTLLNNVADRHISTDWEIKDINNVIVFQSLNDTVNLEEISLPPNTINPNASYAFTVRYNGYHNKSLVGGTIAPIDHSVPIPNPKIATPNVIVQGELNNVSETPTLTSTGFSMVEGNDTHQSTDWRLYMRLNGVETLVWEELGATGSHLLSNIVPQGILYNGPEWVFRIRHNGAFDVSDWGEKVIYSINQPLIIDKPILSLNWIYSYEVPLDPILYTTPFKVLNGSDIHQSTSWEAEIKLNGVWTPHWSSLNDTNDLVGIQLPANSLPINTEVRFRATHEGASGLTNTSNWTYGKTINTIYNGFRQLNSNNIGRLKGSGVLTPNNEVIVFGGEDATNSLIASTEKYSPANDSWSFLNDINVNCILPSAVKVNNFIYKIGGKENTGLLDPILDVEVLDLNVPNATWSLATQLPVNIKDFGCSALNNNMILITGGWSTENVYNITRRTWLYDTVSNMWSAHTYLPDWLKGHCQVTLNNGEVLTIGGMTDNNINYLDKVFVLHTDGVWSTDSFLPEPLREVQAVVTTDGRVFITKGRKTDGTMLDKFIIRDPVTKMWSYGESFPANYPTDCISVALMDNTFVILSESGDSFRYYP